MKRTNDIAIMGLMAALCFVAFNYFKIDIYILGGRTSFHFANMFVVLGALILGGLKGGLAGAIGLTLADLTTGYAHVAPKTFFLKLCIGLIAGYFAHHLLHIDKQTNKSDVLKRVILSSSIAMGFNVIFDPLVGFFFNRYLLGIDVDPSMIIATYAAGVTLANAIITVILSVILYMALRRMKFVPLRK